MKRAGQCLLAMLLWYAGSTAGWAQESRATLTGRVTDPQGGVVPGAGVTVISEDTLVKQQTHTNDQGSWTVAFLNPGNYTITVSAPGFKVSEQKGITLQTADNKVIDVALEVGERSEHVVVTAEAPLIDTTSATSGVVITPQQMTEIPLLSRIPTLLAGLAPGVLLQDQNQNVPRMWSVIAGSQILVNGGRDQRSNEFLLDGAPNVEADKVAFIPPLDSVAEFRIMTNAYDAQYGRQAGSTMNMSFKSGTKDYHGSLYEFNQNNVFNAVPFHLTNQPKLPVHYNLYGGTIGGPVRIPKVYNGKEKTFFFLNFEGTRNQDPRGGIRTVPTAAERQGDFSHSFSTSGGQTFPVKIYDPSTVAMSGSKKGFRPEFANDTIPANRISPIANAIIQKYVPLPNTVGDPGSSASNNFAPVSTRQNKMASFVTRLDHNWNNNHKTYGNIHWNHETEVLDDFFNSLATGGGPNQRIAKGIGLDHVWTLSPSKVLDLRYSLTRWEEPTQSHGAGFDPTNLGFGPSYVSQMACKSFPRFNNVFGNIGGGCGGFFKTTYHNWDANLTQVHHTMSFHYGGEVRVMQEAGFGWGDQSGSFSFGSEWTRQRADVGGGTNNGSTLASFLLGLPTGGSFPNNASSFDSQHYYGLFFQDDWRVTPRLTLNMGLRWDYESPFSERYNRLTDNFDPTQLNPISPLAQAKYAAILAANTSNPIYQQLSQVLPASAFRVYGAQLFAGVNGQPRTAVNGDYRQFQPRFGFAYRIREHTVIRGGFGRFVQGTSLKGGQNGFSASTPFVATTDNWFTVHDSLANPFTNGFVVPTGSTLGPLTNFGSQGPNWDNQSPGKPYSWEYSFHIQQEYKGWLFEAGYSHNKTYNIYWGLNQNLQSFDLWKQLRDMHSYNSLNWDQSYITSHPTCTQTNSCRPADQLIWDRPLANPFQGLAGVQGGLGSGSTRSFSDLIRPLTWLGDFNRNANPWGKNQFDALELKAERRFHKNLSLLTAFTWSKLFEDTAFWGPEISGPITEHKLGGEDRPYRLSLAPIYELPVGRGKRYLASSPRVVNAVLGGWELSGQWLIQSGTPIVFGGNIFYDGQNFALPRGQRTLDRWFDTSHFFKFPGKLDNLATFPSWTGVQNLPGANFQPPANDPNQDKNGVFQDFANYVSRQATREGFARQSRVNEWNLGVFKNFPIHENLKGQFRLETFNAFNHPRFGGPNTDPGSSNFGRVGHTQENTPRLIQFALKLTF